MKKAPERFRAAFFAKVYMKRKFPVFDSLFDFLGNCFDVCFEIKYKIQFKDFLQIKEEERGLRCNIILNRCIIRDKWPESRKGRSSGGLFGQNSVFFGIEGACLHIILIFVDI